MENTKLLNGGHLKLIAIASMVFDHSLKTFLPSDFMIFTYIGRVAFPLFCFLLVEGFLHSKNIKKYIFRMGIFALISEIPFDLAFQFQELHRFQAKQFWTDTNVFYTLFIGLIVLLCIQKCRESIFPTILILFSGYIVAELLQTDYGGPGILLIGLLYLTREKLLLQVISVSLVAIFVFGGIDIYEVCAIIPIVLYNGERGIRLKYFFYCFYPAHLLLFFLLSLYIQ